MIGKVFTKQICCGIASALGFSGSVYFVVKQTIPAEPVTSVTVAAPTSNNIIDLTDPISKVKDVGVDDIDVMFEILNRMQKDGIVPTIQQLIEHKDKWVILAELMKDCFPKKNGDAAAVAAPIKPECKAPDKKEDKEKFLKMFLQFGDKIKELVDQNKKEREKAARDSKDPVKELNALTAFKQVLNAKSLNSSPEKNSHAHAFLKNFQTLMNAKTTTKTDADTKLLNDVAALMLLYQKSDAAGSEDVKDPADQTSPGPAST